MQSNEFPLLRDLDPTQLEAFVAVCNERRYAKGAEIMTRGTHGQHVLFLLEGRVRILVRDPKGDREVAVLSAPAVVGEMELLTGQPRSASVVAVTDAYALAMPFEVFRERMSEGDPACMRVLAAISRVVAERLSAMLDKITELESVGSRVPSQELVAFKRKLFSEWTL